MRTRDVVGHKIVEVRQKREWNDVSRRMEAVVYELVLDNGVLVYPTAHKTMGDVVASMRCVRPRKKRAAT